jgi:hypothetical protein
MLVFFVFKGRKLNQLRKESDRRGALIDRAYIVNIPFLVLKDFDSRDVCSTYVP